MATFYTLEISFKDEWRKLYAFTDDWEAKFKRIMEKAGWDSCKMIVNDIREQSRAPKTGRRYQVQKGARRYWHTASKNDSSETSARLTGRKNRATNFKITPDEWTIGVENTVKYARALEYGINTSRRKLLPRRDLQSGVERNLTKIADNVFKRMEEELQNHEFFYRQ